MSRTWKALGLDLVSLRVFAATAEEGTLARAAERENIAVSAVSRRISELEARIGVQLFDRLDRGVALTIAGRQLLGQIGVIFDLLERIALDLEAIRGGTSGQVRVAAHLSAASAGLPAAVAEFMTANPGIDIRIEETTSLDVLHSVRTSMADVGFFSGNVPPDGLELIPWQSDELVALVPHGHALAACAQLTLAQLACYPFLAMQRDSALFSLYSERARELRIDLDVRLHASSFATVLGSVRAGLGVAILPAATWGSASVPSGVEIRPLAESWAIRPLAICVRDVRRLSAAAGLFVETLRARQL